MNRFEIKMSLRDEYEGKKVELTKARDKFCGAITQWEEQLDEFQDFCERVANRMIELNLEDDDNFEFFDQFYASDYVQAIDSDIEFNITDPIGDGTFFPEFPEGVS